MAAASKAGVRGIGFLCGGFPEQELREAGALKVLHDPDEMLRNWPELVASL